MADQRQTEAASAFLFAEELDSNLGDALEYMPNSPAVMGQGLPVNAYSVGDTTGKGDTPLPSRLLASLPSKVTRRYSPLRAEDASNAPAAPAPSFAVLNRDEDARYQVYPAAPIRVASIETLLGGAQTKQSVYRRAMMETQVGDIVPAPPHAAAFLERLGLPVSREALASTSFTDRGKKKFGIKDAASIPQVTKPATELPAALSIASRAIIIPTPPAHNLDSRQTPAVRVPTGLSRSVVLDPKDFSVEPPVVKKNLNP